MPQVQNEDDWMARHFFTGGTMPSNDLLLHFQVRRSRRAGCQHIACTSILKCQPDPRSSVSPMQDDLAIQQQWYINGRHYSRTLEDWLTRMDAQKHHIIPLFQVTVAFCCFIRSAWCNLSSH